MSRSVCARCLRPASVCYCAHVRSIATSTHVLVLQHPREAAKAIGTARIAKLCLPRCEIAVGVALEQHPLVRAALDDAEREPIVLFPSPRARDLRERRSERPATLIALDGTWAHARALARKNPWLRTLPQYSLAPERPSEYRIRREPMPQFVSTLEALAEALALLEQERDRFDDLRIPFRAMVETQLEFARRSEGGRHRARARQHQHVPRLPLELAVRSLVCMHAEANAWPHDRSLGRPAHPHEVVQLVLARVAVGDSEAAAKPPKLGETLELLARPRAPLASSPVKHSRLARERLVSAPDVRELLTQTSRFLRPDDALCSWGSYSLDLLEREGLTLPSARVDLRKVSGDFFRHRPETLEQTVAQLGLSAPSLGEGRGGERAGMIAALTVYFAERARTGSLA